MTFVNLLFFSGLYLRSVYLCFQRTCLWGISAFKEEKNYERLALALLFVFFFVRFKCYFFNNGWRHDTHMASMRIAQFLRPPTPFVHLRPKFFYPHHLGRPISNEHLSPFPPTPNDNLSVKRKHNPRMAFLWFLFI